MKLSRKEQQELASATITQTLGLIVVCSGLCALTAYADPSWWSSPGTGTQSAVMPEQVVTNDGVVTTNFMQNDYAVVNQGQLKHFTERAVDYLNSTLAYGAGTNLNTMAGNWAFDYSVNGYSIDNPKPSDYAVMNVGQLKYIASLVYGQLGASGYPMLAPTWITANSATDHVAANLGQLKEVFDFDLTLANPVNLTASANTSGTINLTWSLPGNNQATSYSVEQQNPDGTWSVIASFNNAHSHSLTVNGLSAGQNPAFQIVAQNDSSVSMGQSTPPDSGLVSPSNVNATQGPVDTEIDLTWQNNATDARYILVEESLDGVSWSPIASLPPTATSYAVTGLTVGQGYYFGVTAGNN